MLHWLVVLGPLVLLPVVGLLAFVGCDKVFGVDYVSEPPAVYPAEIGADPNLVSYWRFSETSVSDPAADEKNGNAGTYPSAGVTLGVDGLLQIDDPAAPGAINLAARFSGVADPANPFSAYVKVPHNDDSLNPLTFTVEALVQLDPPGSGPLDYRAVVSSRDASAGQHLGYSLYASDQGTWEAWLGDGTDWRKVPDPATTPVADRPTARGDMQFVAMTYDGAGTLTLFVDPIEDDAYHVFSKSWPGYRPNATYELRIGAGANEGDALYRFPGVIDEVAVYSDALNFETLRRHYVMAITGKKLTGL
jgi:hypothetical protein